MPTHLTPEAFNKAAALMLVKAIEHRNPTVLPNIARNKAIRELRHLVSLGGNLLKIVKHETMYFIIEREVKGVSIIPKPGGLGIYVTEDNIHLLTGFVKHSAKPMTMVQWRQIFGG